MGRIALSVALVALVALAGPAFALDLDALVHKHAAANGVPESLVRRVIHIETRGQPRLISKGNYGLMQIRIGTARAMGYTGDIQGLLDADTNMTYAVRYLAGAYRVANGNAARAIHLYQRGYYAEAKAKGFSPYRAHAAPEAEPVITMSVATAPVLAKSVASQPVVSQLAASQPVVAKRVVTIPITAKPVAARTAPTQPVIAARWPTMEQQPHVAAVPLPRLRPSMAAVTPAKSVRHEPATVGSKLAMAESKPVESKPAEPMLVVLPIARPAPPSDSKTVLAVLPIARPTPPADSKSAAVMMMPVVVAEPAPPAVAKSAPVMMPVVVAEPAPPVAVATPAHVAVATPTHVAVATHAHSRHAKAKPASVSLDPLMYLSRLADPELRNAPKRRRVAHRHHAVEAKAEARSTPKSAPNLMVAAPVAQKP
jgi:hypothetical protein